jgi:hypothetical protein
MKICLVCSHGGHLTEMSGSQGRLDPDSGSGTTQSTSKYSMTIKPVPTLDYPGLINELTVRFSALAQVGCLLR